MSDPTFRDFAGAIMGGDLDQAAQVLSLLLALDVAAARRASQFFQAGMQSGPEFMTKAMGMRTVVTDGTREQLSALLGDCFDLRGEAAERAVAAVMARFRPGG
jgi:hypothetical protein